MRVCFKKNRIFAVTNIYLYTMQEKTPSKRILSIDALRGADMFFIVGGEALILTLAGLFPESTFMKALSAQMIHVDWHGFHFMDLIFPLFLFISGVTFPYSLSSQQKRGMTRSEISLRCIRRGLILVAFGLIYNGILSCTDFANFRYASVLGRIGLAWMFASLFNLWFSRKICWSIIPVFLLGYWAMLVAFPESGLDPFSQEGSLVGRIDRAFLPGRLYLGNHDPEGLLGLIPSIVTAMFGIEAGRLLTNKTMTEMRKVVVMVGVGVLFIIIGVAWDAVMPINKNLWTSSFVMLTAGLSLCLLAMFYLVIDVWGCRRLAFFPAVIGMNSITIYLASEAIDFNHTADFLFTGFIDNIFPEPIRPLIFTICFIACWWSFLYFLYRQKIFLRV